MVQLDDGTSWTSSIWVADYILVQKGWLDNCIDMQLVTKLNWYNQSTQCINPEEFNILTCNGQSRIINNITYVCYIANNKLVGDGKRDIPIWIPEVYSELVKSIDEEQEDYTTMNDMSFIEDIKYELYQEELNVIRSENIPRTNKSFDVIEDLNNKTLENLKEAISAKSKLEISFELIPELKAAGLIADSPEVLIMMAEYDINIWADEVEKIEPQLLSKQRYDREQHTSIFSSDMLTTDNIEENVSSDFLFVTPEKSDILPRMLPVAPIKVIKKAPESPIKLNSLPIPKTSTSKDIYLHQKQKKRELCYKKIAKV